MNKLRTAVIVLGLLGLSELPAAPPARDRVLLLEPVILRDDDGEKTARWKLAKELVDRVYTRCDFEVIYSEPRFWNYGKGRRGEVNLDTIVEEAKQARVLRGGRRVATLFFVDAIDGQARLMGRGMQNGNVTFVCLGEGKLEEPVYNFVIAHEVGHNLGLRHAVDDPKVPDEVPNLQGDGPYEKRLAVEGLTEYQRDVVLKSPLVLDRISFADETQATDILRRELAEGSLEGAASPYLRFTLGYGQLSENPRAASQEAAERAAEHVGTFTEAEQSALRAGIAEIVADLDEQWPLLTRFPWSFVKVRAGFCSNFSHTRGRHIFFAAPTLRRLLESPRHLRELLLHEKLHVLQRYYPRRFVKLAEFYGFRRAEGLSIPEEIAELSIPNPDATRHYWGLEKDGKVWVPLTVLDRDKEEKDGEPPSPASFRGLAFAVTGPADKPILDPEQRVSFRDAFPKHHERFSWLRTGHDHPYEVAAYTLPFFDPILSKRETESPGADSPTVQQAGPLLVEALRLGPENLPIPPAGSKPGKEAASKPGGDRKRI